MRPIHMPMRKLAFASLTVATLSAATIGLSAAPSTAIVMGCVGQTFNTVSTCTVAPGETVYFTVVAGHGGQGGAGGNGGRGGNGLYSNGTIVLDGGAGGLGGNGAGPGAGGQVRGSWKNTTNAEVTLTIVVGSNGADGQAGADGADGTNATTAGTAGTPGTPGEAGHNGDDGDDSVIALPSGTAIVVAGGGGGGGGGVGGGGGDEGTATQSGWRGTDGADGTPGADGTLDFPATLPDGWSLPTPTFTDVARVQFDVVIPPATPKGFKGSLTKGKLSLSWSAPTDGPVTAYRVRCIRGTQTYTATVYAPTVKRSFTVTGSGGPFKCRLVSINGTAEGTVLGPIVVS